MGRLLGSLLVVAVAVALPHPSHAQQRTTTLARPAWTDGRLESIRDALRARMQRAQAHDLPARWLRDKVAEGLAKHVPPPRILAATDAVLGRMMRGRRLLRRLPAAKRPEGKARIATLRAAVDALAVDAPQKGLTELTRTVAEGPAPKVPGRLRHTLIAVAELGERGFDAEHATHVVHEVFARDGLPGVSVLLRHARRMPGTSPAARRRALDRAARTRPGPETRGSRVDPPHEERGAPRDDAFGRGERGAPDRRPDPPDGRP